MFWSDRSADTISRAKLDGSEVTVLVNSGLYTVGKSATNQKTFTVGMNVYFHVIDLRQFGLNLPAVRSFRFYCKFYIPSL